MSGLLDEEEAQRLAEELAAKYGHDTLDYVRGRAEQARSVEDDLAYDAWQRILKATEALLWQRPWEVTRAPQ
jgi:hypothetical protein